MASETRAAERLRRELQDPLLASSHPVSRPLLWVLLLSLVAAVAWAAWAELDEVTRGDGRVVPFSRMQKIQSLEGGILDRLLVQEGELVQVGQPLVRLDRTHFETSWQEAANQAEVLGAAIARLDAEVMGQNHIVFPEACPPTARWHAPSGSCSSPGATSWKRTPARCSSRSAWRRVSWRWSSRWWSAAR
jgi:Membrane-fusion protein